MVFTIKIQKLQIICKKSSVLLQKLDKNSLTYDKMKNGGGGLLGHPLELNGKITSISHDNGLLRI